MTYSGASNPRTNAALSPAWQAYVARVNPEDAAAIVAAYGTYAPVIGYDPNLALAQAVQETGNFDSPAWRRRRNPAGLGITGDSVAGPGFGTIERGVQAHLALLNCYYGNGNDPWGVLTEFGMGGMSLGKTTLNGMNGVWAVPGTTYGDAIARIANEVTGGNVTDGVYGEDLIAKAKQYIGQVNSDGTLDTWNRPHPWAYWCEALAEGVAAACGLDEVHRGSAALKLDALTAQGLLQQGTPEHGAWCLFGRNFDPNGHICFWDADKQQFLGTLTDGTGIGYHDLSWLPSMAGWCRVPGVVGERRAAAPVEWNKVDGIPLGPGFYQLYASVSPDTGARLRIFGRLVRGDHAATLVRPDGEQIKGAVAQFEWQTMFWNPQIAPPWDVTLVRGNEVVK